MTRQTTKPPLWLVILPFFVAALLALFILQWQATRPAELPPTPARTSPYFWIAALSIHFLAGAMGIAFGYWLIHKDLQIARETVRNTISNKVSEAEQQIEDLKELVENEPVSMSPQQMAKKMEEEGSKISRILGPERDVRDAALSELGDKQASEFGTYGGLIASRDPRLLMYLEPGQNEELQHITSEIAKLQAKAEKMKETSTEETAKRMAAQVVAEVLGKPKGSIPTVVRGMPLKAVQHYEMPPDPVMQPAYAVGKSLITQEEFSALKSEYFAQCELSLGLILPLILAAFAASYRLSLSWIFFLAIGVALFAWLLFLIAWNRWFRYGMELKLLILGRWDKATEAAQKDKQDKPKPDTAAIQKVVKEELSKLQVEVKPLVVEIRRESKSPSQGGAGNPQSSPGSKQPGTT
jgi:hypothetical protein